MQYETILLCHAADFVFVEHGINLLSLYTIYKSAFQIFRIMKHKHAGWPRENSFAIPTLTIHFYHGTWNSQQDFLVSIRLWPAQNLLRNITVVLLWVQPGTQSGHIKSRDFRKLTSVLSWKKISRIVRPVLLRNIRSWVDILLSPAGLRELYRGFLFWFATGHSLKTQS